MRFVPTRARTRLSPDARRRQILDIARRMFAARPYTEVTVAEIAREAGVTRALVHHYYGSVREIYLAVLGDFAAESVEIPGDIEGLTRAERVARNIDAWLDLMAANRETWLAVAAQGQSIPDEQIRRVIVASREEVVTRMIEANADLISDTPVTRFALRAMTALLVSACEQWLTGQASREEVRRLLTSTFLDVVERTIPKLERAH
jgi:AcrR family transcriptional regulator